MAIVFDRPRRHLFRGRVLWTSHLASDQSGVAGQRELLAAAKELGLRSAWLQHADTAYEHFDLLGADRIERARRSPQMREIDPKELVRIIHRKFHETLEAAAGRVPPEPLSMGGLHQIVEAR